MRAVLGPGPAVRPRPRCSFPNRLDGGGAASMALLAAGESRRGREEEGRGGDERGESGRPTREGSGEGAAMEGGMLFWPSCTGTICGCDCLALSLPGPRPVEVQCSAALACSPLLHIIPSGCYGARLVGRRRQQLPGCLAAWRWPQRSGWAAGMATWRRDDLATRRPGDQTTW